jgi:hypothetical protein
MADKKEKTKDILVRDIPDETYNYIIDEQTRLVKEGHRKSLGALLLEYAKKGIDQSKK